MKKERFLSFGNHKPSTDEHLASCWLSAGEDFNNCEVGWDQV